MSNVLRVLFEPQLHDGYCLPACVSMILHFLGKNETQERIARLLGTSDIGTPLTRIHNLTKWGFHVHCAIEGSWKELERSIKAGNPIIVSTFAEWLPHSQIYGQHAIVVVGIGETSALILDPATTSTQPIEINKNALLAAWTEMDLAYAVISL